MKTQKLAAVREKKSKPFRWKHKRPPGWGRRLFSLLVFLAVTGLMVVGAILFYYATDPSMPQIARASDWHPKLVTKVLAKDGELIGEIFEERRTVVARDKIPDVMIHALVDAEDAQFYQHGGLSYWGMARAILNDLKPGAHLQGASTLTQQLVRNLLLKSSARTIKRKIQELILARRIEKSLSKDDILYLYLNQIEFPYQRFGVDEASRFYFGKSVTDIDVGEAALLASLPKGPTEIDPWKHPERAKDRQRYVLSQMVRYRHLSQKEAESFARAPIRLVRTPSPYLGSAPEIVEEVKRVLLTRFGVNKIATLGLTVHTTCDAPLQKQAREALEKGLSNIDERHGYRKANAHLQGNELKAHLLRLARDFPKGPSMGSIVEAVVKDISVTEKHEKDFVRVDLGAKEGLLFLPPTADRYNPKALAADKRFTVGDVIRVRVIEALPERPPQVALELGPQGAVVVLEPQTREVRALVGGYGYHQGSFDRATQARRQPGSAFKPFVYAAALDTGRFTAASILLDSPQIYTSPGLQAWKPQNAEKEEFVGPVRLRTALARSLNTIASQLVDVERGGVDPAQVVALAKEAGIESTLQPNPSLALGTSEVTPIELTSAYATIAAGGVRRAPQFIRAIADVPESEEARASIQAMKPELAYVLTSMLTSVIQEGTAMAARGKIKAPAAGKTGTTNSHRDAWFVGFTPDVTVGVWVGFDDMRELGRGEQGARAALPIWIDVTNAALAKIPPRPFVAPAGVIHQNIDPATGMLAAGHAGAIDEVFIEGTQPNQTAPAAGEANPDTYLVE